MDDTLLNLVFPSLITVSAIAFALFVSLPHLRYWLRDKFDSKQTKGNMLGTEFFRFTYYIAIVEFLEYIAIGYLVALLSAILSPWITSLKVISYIVIVINTSSLLTYIIIVVIASVRKTLANTMIRS